MRPDYFECLVAVLWQRKGFQSVYRTPDSHDDGVDVVAIGPDGELVQCKSSTIDDTMLSWNAIKDVVTGEAAYRERHPNVRFAKACVTNQFFNDNARRHASLNDVELYDRRTFEGHAALAMVLMRILPCCGVGEGDGATVGEC
jgi:HJR/Mrr/RecB family endonuclease